MPEIIKGLTYVVTTMATQTITGDKTFSGILSVSGTLRAQGPDGIEAVRPIHSSVNASPPASPQVNDLWLATDVSPSSATLVTLDTVQTFSAPKKFAAAGTALTVDNNATIGGTLSLLGTLSLTNALAQSVTHASADTDASPTALHHTLGSGANQAAAGNHTHTASEPLNGYASITATTTLNVASATPVDVTGLSASITVPANRRIQVTFGGQTRSSIANDRAQVGINEGTTNLLQINGPTLVVANSGYTVESSCILTPSAGTHTYKITLARLAGTGNINIGASAVQPAWILVEDIGPAS